ncbi:MAG: hypothetical protein R3C44_05225 [Chloroflexota bacterium]
MIDWASVIFNAFWISGLALILAAVSYYYWVAREEGQSVTLEFQQPAFLRFVYAGLILVGIGLIGTSPSLIQSLLAGALIVLSFYGLFRLYQQTRENRS